VHYLATSAPANQLMQLDRIGMLVTPLPSPDVLPWLADPLDVEEPVQDRARAYLQSNCAECHQPGTGVPSTMDLRYATLLANTNICDVAPERNDLGLGASARLLAPGDPDDSIILQRMSRRDEFGMPPIGSHLVDDDGVDLIEEWIEELQVCQ
jgi:hypothetical protein